MTHTTWVPDDAKFPELQETTTLGELKPSGNTAHSEPEAFRKHRTEANLKPSENTAHSEPGSLQDKLRQIVLRNLLRRQRSFMKTPVLGAIESAQRGEVIEIPLRRRCKRQ